MTEGHTRTTAAAPHSSKMSSPTKITKTAKKKAGVSSALPPQRQPRKELRTRDKVSL